MSLIKNNKEIQNIKIASKIVAKVHAKIKKSLKVGMSGLEIDKLVYKEIIKHKAKPSFLNYDGFPNSACISINDEVVHGIPSDYRLKNGDIVSIDIGVMYNGYHGDSAWTYQIGEISKEDKFLLEKTELALLESLKIVKAGIRVGEISNIIWKTALENNLSVVEELTGHGIGKNIHEDPMIPNIGNKDEGMILKEGMCIAIEPIFNFGSSEIFLEQDNWTIKTIDKSKSAHFEHTILIKKDGCEILTKI